MDATSEWSTGRSKKRVPEPLGYSKSLRLYLILGSRSTTVIWNLLCSPVPMSTKVVSPKDCTSSSESSAVLYNAPKIPFAEVDFVGTSIMIDFESAKYTACGSAATHKVDAQNRNANTSPFIIP